MFDLDTLVGKKWLFEVVCRDRGTEIRFATRTACALRSWYAVNEIAV